MKHVTNRIMYADGIANVMSPTTGTATVADAKPVMMETRISLKVATVRACRGGIRIFCKEG
jgi:hypothetical protein